MPSTFDDALEELGFQQAGRTRFGGLQWVMPFNTHLEFALQDNGDHVVLSWRFDLGEYLLRKGWQIGAAETSFQELYPQADVKLPTDVEAVEAELKRVLLSMRLDLGDPTL